MPGAARYTAVPPPSDMRCFKDFSGIGILRENLAKLDDAEILENRKGARIKSKPMPQSAMPPKSLQTRGHVSTADLDPSGRFRRFLFAPRRARIGSSEDWRTYCLR
jgi:hypothetical protein